MPIRKILLPTDFSDLAKAAGRYAAELARAFDAELVLLHVTEEPFDYKGYGLSAETILRIQQDMDAVVSDNLEAARVECGEGIVTKLSVRQGTPSFEIVAAAEAESADMIVMATHGHAGFKHLVLGSTTERVVRLAACPVLTVRENQYDFVVP